MSADTDASEPRRRRVVLLRNTFENLGDLAMLVCEVDALRRHLPGVQVSVLSDDHRLATRFPDVEWGESDVILSSPASSAVRDAIRRSLVSGSPGRWRRVANRALAWMSTRYRRGALQAFRAYAAQPKTGHPRSRRGRRARRLLQTLRSADVVVGGGGLIGSIPAISEPRRAVYRALRGFGIPYVLNGLSLTDPWTDSTYSGAALTVVRDRLTSWQHAIECGVRPERLVHVVDPAFGLVTPIETNVTAMLRTLELEASAFVAVNLRGGSEERVERLLHSIAVFLPEAVRRLGCKRVLLFGMQRFRENDDGDILGRLRALLPSPLSAVTWLPDANPALLKGVLARAQAVLSCRYHGAVFGLSSAVPTVGLTLSREYDIKLRGLFHHYGLDRFCLPAERLDGGGASLLDEILHRDREMRDRLRAVNEQLAATSDRPYERIRELLDGN